MCIQPRNAKGQFVKAVVPTTKKLVVIDSEFDGPVVKASLTRPDKYYVQVSNGSFVPLTKWTGVITVAERNIGFLGQVQVVKAGIQKALVVG